MAEPINQRLIRNRYSLGIQHFTRQHNMQTKLILLFLILISHAEQRTGPFKQQVLIRLIKTLVTYVLI